MCSDGLLSRFLDRSWIPGRWSAVNQNCLYSWGQTRCCFNRMLWSYMLVFPGYMLCTGYGQELQAISEPRERFNPLPLPWSQSRSGTCICYLTQKNYHWCQLVFSLWLKSNCREGLTQIRIKSRSKGLISSDPTLVPIWITFTGVMKQYKKYGHTGAT